MILTLYTHNNIQTTNRLYKTILGLTLFQKINSEDQLDNVAHQDTFVEAKLSKFILMMPKTQVKNQELNKFQKSKSRSIKN